MFIGRTGSMFAKSLREQSRNLEARHKLSCISSSFLYFLWVCVCLWILLLIIFCFWDKETTIIDNFQHISFYTILFLDACKITEPPPLWRWSCILCSFNVFYLSGKAAVAAPTIFAFSKITENFIKFDRCNAGRSSCS